MKILLILSLLATAPLALAQGKATKTNQATSTSNAASTGSGTMSGISESPLGPNEQEKKAVRARAQSMGGAPEVGGGMATGTGAGSRVGKKTGVGTVNAGSPGTDDEEKR